MAGLLFLGMVVLAVLLADTRKRLAQLERENRESRPYPATVPYRKPVATAAEESAGRVAEPVGGRPSPWAAARTVHESAASTSALFPAPSPFPSSSPAPAPAPFPGEPKVEPAPTVPPSPAHETIAPPPSGVFADGGASSGSAPDASGDPDAPKVAKAAETQPGNGEEPENRYRPSALSFGFEELFGRKLPIWAGGITLLVAAVLLVKYSIDAGLLSPTVRVVLGVLFGGALIGGAEIARRSRAVVQDDRIGQSLAGAGLGSLYASTLAAANLYGLVGPGTAFAALAAITALAMGLALRFGAPSAVLGLVGGLATPAVINSSAPNIPLLAGYIAVVVGALTLLSRHQRWMWLGVSALVGGMGWSLLLILWGGLASLSLLSVGVLILLLGLALPVLAANGEDGPRVRGGAAMAAALQLALLVATGGFEPLSWGLYGLLSIAFLWLTGRVPSLRPLLLVPLLLALALAGFWPQPDAALFAAVIGGILVIYGLPALWRLWRPGGGLVETAMLAAIALGGEALSYGHFHSAATVQDARFAGLALAFALVPGLAAALGWRSPRRGADDQRLSLLLSTVGVLLVLAAVLGLPLWTLPVALAGVAAALLALAGAARDDYLLNKAQVFLSAGLLVLYFTGEGLGEVRRLVADLPPADLAHPDMAHAVSRWGAMALATALFAWRGRESRAASAFQGLTVLLGYGLVAQIVPAAWLATITGAALLGLSVAAKRASCVGALTPGLGVLAAIGALWAVGPMAQWAVPALASLSGVPMMAADLPGVETAIRMLLLPSVAALLALGQVRPALPPRIAVWGTRLAGAAALIGLHILYKQLFRIDTPEAFVQSGLAERTLWEIALIMIGGLAWRVFGPRDFALAGIGAALAHNLVYSLGLHNPLWSAQAVGPLPLANLLVPAFGVAILAPLALVRIAPDDTRRLLRTFDRLRMLAILLGAYALLRQLFVGSVIAGQPVGPVENIGWSVLAIVLAVGFLLWGIRRGLGDWRIASLLLMVTAVGKVFLLDASGLDGLLRIASFLALGFSLIGIGWLYSRYLRPGAMGEESSQA